MLPLSGDQRKTEQLLLNLDTNFIIHDPAGGSIEITAWNLAEDVAVTVTDYRRRHIPEEDLERVLKPFEQVDSSFRRQHQGAGLGLSLVKAIMEMYPSGLAARIWRCTRDRLGALRAEWQLIRVPNGYEFVDPLQGKSCKSENPTRPRREILKEKPTAERALPARQLIVLGNPRKR